MMNSIQRFSITRLRISGFKNFAEPRCFEFGKANAIVGHNRQGKTTIADAIAFAITGTGFFGGGRLDYLYALDKPQDIMVELVYVNDTGDHCLFRQRKNDKMSMFLDGVPIRQTDLDTMFGEKELFLSMFNPQYFITELGTKGRDLLLRYLPPFAPALVLEELNEQFRDDLTDLNLEFAPALLQSIRAKRRECDENQTHLEGRLLQLEQGQKESAIQGERLSADLVEATAMLADLKERQFAGLDLTNLQGQVTCLCQEISVIEQTAKAPPDTTQVDAEIESAIAALEQRKAEQYTPQYAEATKTERLTVVLRSAEVDLYQRFSKQLDGNCLCPVCRQSISAEFLPHTKAGCENRMIALQEEIAGRKVNLAELQKLEKQSAGVFEQYRQQDIVAQEQKLSDLRSERKQLFSAVPAPNTNAQRMQLAGLQHLIKMGNLSDAEFAEMGALEQTQTRIEAQLSVLRPQSDSAKADIERQMQESVDNSQRYDRQIAALMAFINKRYELLFRELTMNRVEISLFDVVKSTGEVKDAFKFTYEGRPYHSLSASEQTQAGLEVALLMGKLTGKVYPVYIDNAEGINQIDNASPAGQVMMAYAEKGKALAIDILAPLFDTMPAAA